MQLPQTPLPILRWFGALLGVFFALALPARAIVSTGLFPASGATAVCADTPLKITFDAAPTIGTSGTIKLYNAAGALLDTIDLALNAPNGTQSRTIAGVAHSAYPVLVSGNTATIFPRSGVLPYNTICYVTIDAAVFPGFAGISGSTTWRFTTKTSAPSSSSTYLTVSADGTADFCTVQGAIDLIPANNTTRRYINIRNGTYREIVRVTSKHNLALRGQHRKRTVIAYPNNNNINPGTALRPLFNVAANDVSFDNLTLENTTPKGGSQAETLRVNGQRCVVNACDLLSYQDTFLVNSASDTAYLKDSLIAGDVDFVWGTGRAVFQSCEIKSLSGGYICQMRNAAGQYGAVFLDCRFTASAGVSGVYLARIDPNTFPASSVALVNCAVDTHIAPTGWLLSATGPTAALRFWEYQSTTLAGAALNVASRAAFSAQLNATQASALRDVTTVLGAWSPVPPPPAFPGAEGAGKIALGGRGGDVYYVTTLADSGAGSLRDAIATAPSTGRTILFKVSGTIALASNLVVNKPRITIAGQSAQGGGITLKNYNLRVSSNDLIIRHLRSRLGTDAAREDDAITIWDGINVILDHCSASWSVDEVLSSTGYTDNVTTQWCYISEALDNSIHTKGPHGFGSIVASYLPGRLSWLHNLYIHNQSRNPRPGSYNNATINFDFRNNVLYNWGYYAGYSSGSPEATDMNYVGNYLVKGPGSTRDAAFNGGGASTRIYQAGNKIDLNKNGVFDGTDTGWSMFSGTYTQQAAPFDFLLNDPVEPADLALQRVISQVGAFPWNRDSKDSALANHILTGTGGFVDSVPEAGDYPVLDSPAPPADTDGDGMPNSWESAFGSDPAVANNNADADGDGYTDLEEYLHWLAAPHATTAKDQSIDLDLNLLNGSRSGLTYTLSAPLLGTVSLLPDGRTARFIPTPGVQGLGGFAFSFTALGQTITQTVGVAISAGLPKELAWTGAVSATWDAGTSANFANGAVSATFTQADNVTFAQSGANPTVTLAAALGPTTLTVNATKDYTFGGNGSLTGSMTLFKSGSGRLTLNTANTYTGGTVITGGNITLGNTTALGTGPVTVSNAGLNIAGFNLANPLTVSGNTSLVGLAFAKVNTLSGDGLVNVTVSTTPFDLNGNASAFSGTLALTNGIGIRFLTAFGTGAPAATLDLGSSTGSASVRNNLPAISLGALKGGPSTILYGQTGSDLPTTFTLGGNDADSTFSGSIRDGTFATGTADLTHLVKTGDGTLTLAGNNTYTGTTAVNSGTLRVTGSLGATAVTLASGATLSGTGSIAGSVLVPASGNLVPGAVGVPGTLTISGGLTLNNTALTFDLANSVTAGSGVNDLIALGGGPLALSGNVTITPNLLNGALVPGTYTLVSGGASTTNTATLVWGGPPAGGRQSVAFDASTPGTLRLVVTGAPATLTWNGSANSTWNSGDPANPAIGAANWRNGAAADRFVKFDAVTFDDSLVGTTAILSGNVEPRSVTVSTATKSLTLNSSAGSIIGATSLVKSGAATLSLEGNNTYSGGTVLNGGVLQLLSDTANTSALGSGTVTLSGGTLAMYSNFNAASASTSTWDLIVPVGQTGGLSADARCVLRGTLTGGGVLNLYIPDIRTDIAADWSAFTGRINVSTDANGGDFRIANNYTPTGLPLASVDLAANTRLQFSGIVNTGNGTLIELGALAGVASAIVQGGPTTGRPFTWRVGGLGTDTAFAGTLSEQAAGCLTGLHKVGPGTLTLSGTASHAGPTLVSAGKLVVSGTVTTSPFTIEAGATLAGTGSVAALSVAGDATLSPADTAPGALAVTGGLTLAPESIVRLDLGTSFDQLNITGNLTLGGTLQPFDTGSARAGLYPVFTYTGTRSGSPTLLPLPGFSTTLDTSAFGVVRVKLSATTYSTWAREYFSAAELLNPAISGPNATPANDALPNLLKYALGLPPKTASTTGITLARPASDFVFTYTRPALRPDLVYAVEISPTLAAGSWTTVGVTHLRVTTGDIETWQATAAPDPSGRLFFRLKVTQ